MKDDAKNQFSAVAQIKPKKASSELRLGDRVDIRPNEGVSAEIFSNGDFIPTRVFDVSTTGICIVVKDITTPLIKPLEILKIRVNFKWREPVTSDYQVCWVTAMGNEYKIGLRLSSVHAELSSENVPDELMIPVSESYPLTGYLYKDSHYFERSIFHLLKLSSKHAIIEVFDKEHMFFPQQNVELLFSLQSHKIDKLKGHISQIQGVTKDSVKLVIQIDLIQKNLESDLINHLVLNPNINLETIRKAGFQIKHVANHFRFRFVKTQEEYEQVLKLRFEAYKAAGKVTENASFVSMVAPLDHISRILIALHGEKVVASVSLSFPESNDLTLDTERPLKEGYPSFIPQKIEMIEVARLCTDPNYRRGDLLLRMFEHIYKVFVTSGRKYLISSTDKKLWPIYKNLGFKKVGLKYAHPYLAGIEHDIILIDIRVPTSGYKISLLRWWILYSRMTHFLESREEIKRSRAQMIRFKIYKMSAKVFEAFSNRTRK